MKPDIHPAYNDTTVTCGCGNTFTTRSTSPTGQLTVEVCSACHPFYTGKQKILDTGGRVARFEKRFGKRATAGAAAATPPTSSTTDGARAAPLRGGTGAVACPAPGDRRVPQEPDFGRAVRRGSDPIEQQRGDRLADLLAEHASLERELADPAVHADQSRARRLGRRYAQLAPLVETARALDEARGDLGDRPRARRRGRVVRRRGRPRSRRRSTS